MTLAGPEAVELEWSNYNASSCRQQFMVCFLLEPWPVMHLGTRDAWHSMVGRKLLHNMYSNYNI